MRALQPAHVLDRTQQRNIDVSQESEELPSIQMRDVLRADDHDGTVELDDAHELLLEIGGPRW